MSGFDELKTEVTSVEDISDVAGFLEEVAEAGLGSTEEGTLLKMLKEWSEGEESGFTVSLTLKELREDLEKVKAEQDKEELEEASGYSLDEKEKEAAQEFLENENVLELIDRELGKEIVGEENTRKICFLSLTSALIPDKIHLRLTGPSGGGKSHILNIVSSFFPDEMFALRRTRVTPTYFEYALQGLDLDGMIIQIQEWEGAEGAEVTLRPLLSGDQDGIKAGIVDRNSQGQLEARDLEATGKPVFQTASTQLELDKEFETRTWRSEIDASEEQTGAVLKHHALEAMGEDAVTSDKRDLIRNCIRFLGDKPSSIRIYYAGFIADSFPRDDVRLRRDFKKILALIKAHAFLHQYHRPKVEEDGELHILATREDYEAVMDMVKQSFGITVKDLDSNLRNVYDCIKDMTTLDETWEEPAYEVEDVSEEMSLAKETARKYLRQLAEKGYLDKEDHPDDKRKNRYKISAAEKDVEADLPSFKEALDPLDREKIGLLVDALTQKSVEIKPSRYDRDFGKTEIDVYEVISQVLSLEEATATDIQGIWKSPEISESCESQPENELDMGIRLISDEEENNENQNGEEDEDTDFDDFNGEPKADEW